MNSLGVVLFLVRCSADLLVCQTLPTDNLHYAGMETCRSEVSRMVSENSQEGVLMGKCLYRLGEADPRRASRDARYTNTAILQTADAGM